MGPALALWLRLEEASPPASALRLENPADNPPLEQALRSGLEELEFLSLEPDEPLHEHLRKTGKIWEYRDLLVRYL